MGPLREANREWATRAADERFGGRRSDLIDAADAMKSRCFTGRIADLRAANVTPDDGGNLMLNAEGGAARLSAYAFGQMAQIVGAPASYLATLPPDLAAQCVNNGIANMADETARTVLMENTPDGFRARGLESDVYQRLWNVDFARALIGPGGLGDEWVCPPAYNVAAPAPAGAPTGPMGTPWPTFAGGMSPQGLYLGDRSMFIFMVNERKSIDVGDGETLNRGFFAWNGEIAGTRSVGGMEFFYDAICGNHFVWNPSGVTKWSFRHVGATLDAKAFGEVARMLNEYASTDATAEAEQIKASKTVKIAETREETIEIVRNVTGLTKRATLASLALADAYADAHGANGDYLWGAVSGITRYSQASQWADDRVAVDAAAAKLFVRLAA